MYVEWLKIIQPLRKRASLFINKLACLPISKTSQPVYKLPSPFVKCQNPLFQSCILQTGWPLYKLTRNNKQTMTYIVCVCAPRWRKSCKSGYGWLAGGWSSGGSLKVPWRQRILETEKRHTKCHAGVFSIIDYRRKLPRP